MLFMTSFSPSVLSSFAFPFPSSLSWSENIWSEHMKFPIRSRNTLFSTVSTFTLDTYIFIVAVILKFYLKLRLQDFDKDLSTLSATDCCFLESTCFILVSFWMTLRCPGHELSRGQFQQHTVLHSWLTPCSRITNECVFGCLHTFGDAVLVGGQ